MKICILTQPLGHNYGGLLQAYALQAYLKLQGHEVITLDRAMPTRLKDIERYYRNYYRSLIGKVKTIPTKQRVKAKLAELDRFKSEQMNLSERMVSQRQLIQYFKQHHYDAVIVGSDQVWRPRYSPKIENYFLDFLSKVDSRAKRISYAASFGVDQWEFSDSSTKNCKSLLQQFDAVSVREASAVSLCKQYFDVAAEFVLDPTLLLVKEDYVQLLTQESQATGNAKKVVSYMIDLNAQKNAAINKLTEETGFEHDSILPQKDIVDLELSEISQAHYRSVEQWLQMMFESGFVITDSFHGTIFAIIFNRPFISFGNASRGLARFKTLLSLFGLEDRLILSPEELTPEKVNQVIDWEKVNRLKEKHAKLGQAFLQEALSD